LLRPGAPDQHPVRSLIAVGVTGYETTIFLLRFADLPDFGAILAVFLVFDNFAVK
jgi:hypothetical protein